MNLSLPATVFVNRAKCSSPPDMIISGLDTVEFSAGGCQHRKILLLARIGQILLCPNVVWVAADMEIHVTKIA